MSIRTTKSLDLALADEIASLAILTCGRNAFNPVAVCVMDPAGNEIVTKRMDGCPAIAYPAISRAKANTCVAVKMSSRKYGDKYLKDKEGNPSASDAFPRVLNQISTMHGQMAAFQGGVLIRDGEGDIVGSIGISGAAGDEDEYCGLKGVELCSLGHSLITEPAEHSCKTVKEG
jgi:uncharacterized protein GlcG (DUF336 family)